MADPLSIKVAPELGLLSEAIEVFQTARPSYYRGGGDSVTRALEAALTQYIGGTHCVVMPSGQAANACTLSALMPPGGRGHAFVSSRLFGTTGVLVKQAFQQAGYEITHFDPGSVANLRVRPDTKVIFTETSSNPEGVVADLDPLSKLARAHNIPLVVDHTLTAGFAGFDPFEYADVATVSLTKQAGGGLNRAAGGVILLNDRFDWDAQAEKFEIFNRYYLNGGKVVLPQQPFGAVLRKIATWQGTCVSPMHVAEEIIAELPGLQDRVTAMRNNARELAMRLMQHPGVDQVRLAGTDSAANSMRAWKYFAGSGFVLFLDIKYAESQLPRFIEKIQRDGVVSHSVQLGQRQTAVVVPGHTTNRQASLEDLAARGMNKTSIRVSVGVERPDVIWPHFEEALKL